MKISPQSPAVTEAGGGGGGSRFPGDRRGRQKVSEDDDALDISAISYNIDQHDYSVRLRAARKFLQDGDKVKVIVNMKGRENEFRNIAIEFLRRFQTEGWGVPNKKVLRKAQEPPPKKKKKPADDEVSAASITATQDI